MTVGELKKKKKAERAASPASPASPSASKGATAADGAGANDHAAALIASGPALAVARAEAALAETRKDNRLLEEQLGNRNRMLEHLKESYLRDVVVVKEVMFQYVEEGEWGGGLGRW